MRHGLASNERQDADPRRHERANRGQQREWELTAGVGRDGHPSEEQEEHQGDAEETDALDERAAGSRGLFSHGRRPRVRARACPR